MTADESWPVTVNNMISFDDRQLITAFWQLMTAWKCTCWAASSLQLKMYFVSFESTNLNLFTDTFWNNDWKLIPYIFLMSPTMSLFLSPSMSPQCPQPPQCPPSYWVGGPSKYRPYSELDKNWKSQLLWKRNSLGEDRNRNRNIRFWDHWGFIDGNLV